MHLRSSKDLWGNSVYSFLGPCSKAAGLIDLRHLTNKHNMFHFIGSYSLGLFVTNTTCISNVLHRTVFHVLNFIYLKRYATASLIRYLMSCTQGPVHQDCSVKLNKFKVVQPRNNPLCRIYFQISHKVVNDHHGHIWSPWPF